MQHEVLAMQSILCAVMLESKGLPIPFATTIKNSFAFPPHLHGSKVSTANVGYICKYIYSLFSGSTLIKQSPP